MYTLGCDGSSDSDAEAEPHNIWNQLLAAMVPCSMEDVPQPSLSAEDIGKVALTCRFACDAVCEDLCDWDGV